MNNSSLHEAIISSFLTNQRAPTIRELAARFQCVLHPHSDEVSITVKDGELVDKDYVIHFPIPMANAWNNVIFTCSVMLVFRDEAEVDAWCATRGIPKGDVRPIDQIWTFKEWYGRHADADWTKWSLREAVEIFRRHNLTGPVWAIGGDAERF